MDFDRLAARFRDIGYTIDGVLERIGQAGQDGLIRNSTVPADAALRGSTDPLACLIRLFILQREVAARHVRDAVDVDALCRAGYLQADGHHLRARIDIRPYGSPDDGATGWVVADPTPGLDFVTEATRPDYVLGVSPASTTLAQLTARIPVASALDLGTGCGVQSLHLARHAGRVVATDVNPRALELAGATAALNGVGIDLRRGSLYEPVSGQRFDLIVSNPPFVMSPPRPPEETLAYREAGLAGDLLVETLVRGAAEHLTEGGSLQLLTNWAILGDDGHDRLLSWAPPECDMWVIERERLDPFAYIEMWLADAGLEGSPRWRPAYDDWLGYFDELAITGVGMGWIQLIRTGRSQPHLQAERWPHPVAQPVGHVFASRAAAVSAARESTAKLLDSSPSIRDVEQESVASPGAEHPSQIVFRQRTGLRRALRVDTASAAVLGALDGDLTLGQVISAVAHVLNEDATRLAADVLPMVREALLHQMVLLESPNG